MAIAAALTKTSSPRPTHESDWKGTSYYAKSNAANDWHANRLGCVDSHRGARGCSSRASPELGQTLACGFAQRPIGHGDGVRLGERQNHLVWWTIEQRVLERHVDIRRKNLDEVIDYRFSAAANRFFYGI